MNTDRQNRELADLNPTPNPSRQFCPTCKRGPLFSWERTPGWHCIACGDGPPKNKPPLIPHVAIEKSAWAKEFKADSHGSYATAIRFALDPTLRVEIVKTNEAGEWQWVICAVSHDPGFWMDAKKTKREALKLCREMGWKQFR